MLRATIGHLGRLSKSGLTAAAAVAISLAAGSATPAWADVDSIRLDYAYYSPVSLVLQEQGWLEEEFAADGPEINWVRSPGSNQPPAVPNGGSVTCHSSERSQGGKA